MTQIQSLKHEEIYKNHAFVIFQTDKGFILEVYHELTKHLLFKYNSSHFKDLLKLKDHLKYKILADGQLGDLSELMED